jgi:hypothetical protein
MSDYLSRLESSLKTTFVQIGKSKVVTSFIAIRIDNYLNIIALLLLVYGLAVVVYFGFIDDYSAWGEHADRIRFNTLRDVTPIFFAGLFLILRKALGKPFNPEHESAKNARSTLHSKTSWMFFGEAIDLILIQSALILMLVVMHRDGLLTIAYVLALLVVVVGYLLARFGSYIFGYATIACGALYLFYRHVWFSDLMFSIESLTRTLEGPTLISVTPYMWLMIASVAVPHLRLIRLGSMQYGKLRGDISFTIAKHEIFLPLVSALVFSVLWFGVLAAVRDGYYWTIGRMF